MQDQQPNKVESIEVKVALIILWMTRHHYLCQNVCILPAVAEWINLPPDPRSTTLTKLILEGELECRLRESEKVTEAKEIETRDWKLKPKSRKQRPCIADKKPETR